MKEQTFYKMLSKIHNEIADMACGCMGYGYTPENVERDDTHTSDYSKGLRDNEGRGVAEFIPSDRKLDYIGNIIRTYIKVEDN